MSKVVEVNVQKPVSPLIFAFFACCGLAKAFHCLVISFT